MRQLVVDYYVHELGYEYTGEDEQKVDNAFMVQINLELIKNRGKPSIKASERSVCHYHRHHD